MPDQKSIIFWIIGTVCIFFGSLISGSVEPEALGATMESVILAYLIGIILLFLGGMFWISAAVVHVEEE